MAAQTVHTGAALVANLAVDGIRSWFLPLAVGINLVVSKEVALHRKSHST
jgi:hypothetical protein